MKILIVEDSATLRQGMVKLVSQLGHQPVVAASGVEALQLVGVEDFELVLMDVEMPGLNGFETTALMREALGSRWVPIIFATSHTGDDSVLAGIEAGGDDYLIKPLSRGLLEAKIKAMQRIAAMQSQLNRLNSELALLSKTDSLTQLLNRRAFSEMAAQSLLEGRRFQHHSALIMLDVDHFKRYNDSMGHLAGDKCLRSIADCLRSVVKRESDLVARYGGEEFILLLPDTDRRGAITVGQRLLESVRSAALAHPALGEQRCVTVSVGLALSDPRLSQSLDELILQADQNLYRAKAGGRDRLVHSELASEKTILLLTTDENEHAQLRLELQSLGNVIHADSCGECLDLLRAIAPDLLIVSTHHAPNMADALAGSTLTSAVPCIHCGTAMAEGELLQRARTALEDSARLSERAETVSHADPDACR